MKFECEKTLLASAIDGVSRAITNRAAIPVLEGIYMKAEGFNLTLTGYDMEMGITTTIECNVLVPGETVLDAKLLSAMVNRMPAGDVCIELNDEGQAKISGGVAEFEIPALNASDYPSLPVTGADNTMTVKCGMLREMIEKTIYAVSQDDKKPAHTGELFVIEPGSLTIVALDGYRLAIIQRDVECTRDIRIIIPAKTLQELLKIMGGADGRRRFMDSALCQVYRPYLVALRRYMRLTAQKNALLKSYDITPNGNMLLDTYDEQLAEYGALIMEHRCKFLAAAAPIAAQNYRDISHGAEVLTLNYQMCTAAPTAAALTEKMRAMRSAELRAGFCLAGPHREDLEILLDGQPARVFGSQGQQRSCVLAMKLAEATVVGDLFGEHPVLLLDDVLSELDDERQTYLLTRMGEHQTIVTTCDTAAFARTNGKIVMVKGGVVEEA